MNDTQLPIQIFSEKELIDHLMAGGEHFSHCISIRNPEQTMPAIFKTAFRSILELKFYDVATADQLGPAQTIKRVPERIDVKGVIEFFKRTRAQASGYVIHCWQGISRSPAVALGVLYLITGSEEAAAKALNRLRPDSRPHQTLVRFFDEELGSHLTRVNAEILRRSLESLRGELAALAGDLSDARPATARGLLARATSIRPSGGR